MAAPTSGASVELADVVKDYGTGSLALDSLSLHAQPGEFVALLGPSGCGKTTALRSVAGLESVTSGRISIDGYDVTTQPTNKRDLGMVFQSYSLFPHLDALANVEFGLRMRKVPTDERRERALESLEMVGLGGFGKRFAHQLSGGQQQRVALARALVTRPRVLLLDEPLSALDAKVRVQLREEIRRIQTELGITTLFVTHDQEEALAVADRVAVMRAGRIEQIGTPESLYTQPATTFVAEFVGLSNRLPGLVSGGFVEVYGVELPLLDPTVAKGPATVYLRPEDVEIVGCAGGAAGGAGAAGSGLLTPQIRGTVVSSSFLGSIRRSTVRLPDGELIAVQHGVSVKPASGENVSLRFTGACVSVSPREAPSSVAA
ncbi:ABC transporter ATP-binding protein [Subtercola boreus]|uniref:ABC-type quaternary amine transporter n=1 Tax=Subtercola boreus TaxID=120213 RepID=A0A3E0W910_9MICO|nr:ABC transporter ATP-binding protein [Subtercola boreus]RFA18695.1 spermidine/putrescine ABC transporter ATP-binding protein [Subtercola boreus]RFA18717.1 spermidine/putrescine ABC transporter ATP-binding protein [Subtercola boreus]RFA25328.1 spermidine/putrescine ABC transporter ATP-binding protein [Subtercola boreus]